MPYKISFSGACHSGKTTLIDALTAVLGDKCQILHERVRSEYKTIDIDVTDPVIKEGFENSMKNDILKKKRKNRFSRNIIFGKIRGKRRHDQNGGNA